MQYLPVIDAPNMSYIKYVPVQSAQVLLGLGPDRVSVETLLPSPDPNDSHELRMDFQVEKDKGVEYVRKHFKIEPTVIERYVPAHQFKFSERSR